MKYREANFDEEWMIVVTTDHGRSENGHGHGGQSKRERTTWISTNQPVNERFNTDGLAIVDIIPSICRFMGFNIPQQVGWEQDGIPFIGQVDITQMSTSPYDNSVTLSWNCLNPDAMVDIYVSSTNQYKEGGKDQWKKSREFLPRNRCMWFPPMNYQILNITNLYWKPPTII